MHRVSRDELLRSLQRKAQLEGLSAKRPAVVSCQWCKKLIAVKPTGRPPMFCRGGRCAYLYEQQALRLAADASPLRLMRPSARAALIPGPGDRRDDCRRYAECLDTFVRKTPGAAFCHCPPDCSGFIPIPRESLIQIASLGAVSQLAELGQQKRASRHATTEDDDAAIA